MITLIGTVHSDVRKHPNKLEDQISRYRFDHIFVEGMSDEVLQSRSEDAVETIYEEVKEELTRNNFTEDTFRSVLGDIQQGPEPNYIQNNSSIDPEKVTFLDNDNCVVQSGYTVKEHILAEEKVGPKDGIDKLELEEKMLREKDTRKDYIDYFRFLRESGYPELDYTAISNEQRFNDYMKHLAKDFSNGNSLAKELDLNNYDEIFRDSIEEYDIDRFDLQELIHEDRDHDFQAPRDQLWYQQVSEYVDQNPEESILLVCGLNHLTAKEGTLRSRLENEGYSDEIIVRPLS